VELYLHFSNTPLWRGAQLSTATILSLPLHSVKQKGHDKRSRKKSFPRNTMNTVQGFYILVTTPCFQLRLSRVEHKFSRTFQLGES